MGQNEHNADEENLSLVEATAQWDADLLASYSGMIDPDGRKSTDHFEVECIDIGVDMIALHAYLPDSTYDKDYLKATFSGPGYKLRKHSSFFVGQRQVEGVQFELSRFPSRQLSGFEQLPGFDLKIRFNPSTLIHKSNWEVADASCLELALQHVQDTLFTLGLTLGLGVAVSSLSLVELHLARDICFHCNAGDRDSELESEQDEVQEILRFLSWSIPRYSRRASEHNDAKKAIKNKRRKAVEAEVLEEGLTRGNKGWQWTIYDKSLEMKQKGIIPPVSTGRILRIEWKLKNKTQIKKRLALAPPSEPSSASTLEDLLVLVSEDYSRLKACFDCELTAAYFRLFVPPNKHLPRIPVELVNTLAPWFEFPRQQVMYDSLVNGERILPGEIDDFIQVVNRAGPDRMRTLLRHLYGMDSDSPRARRRKEHDHCREMLLCLRQRSSWNAQFSYLEKREQILEWIHRWS